MRISQSQLRRQWKRLAARCLEVLWSCPCEYNNVATYRCYGCGSRPPREVRDYLRSIPVPALVGPVREGDVRERRIAGRRRSPR